MLVETGRARTLAEGVLMKHGASPEHARIQADLLVEAELRGFPSHGLLRLRRVIERIQSGVTVPGAKGKHNWLGRNFLSVDGEMGFGPVIAKNAMDAAGVRAAEDGIAVAAIHNSNHIGMLAWYSGQLPKGQMLIAATTSEALMYPWGGRKAMLGTNPISIIVPADPEPFVLDMATSHVAMGKIHDYALRGEAIPLGWAIDAEGNPTTDANAAKKGAIAPFGGPKGYALGLALEVLITSLSGAAIGTDVTGTLDSTTACNKGDIFILIAPKQGDSAKKLVNAYLDEIRNTPPFDPKQPVMVPGDMERKTKARHLKDGLNLDDALWRDLTALEQEANGKS